MWVLKFGGHILLEFSLFPLPCASPVKQIGTQADQCFLYLSTDDRLGEEVAEDLESTESLLKEKK